MNTSNPTDKASVAALDDDTILALIYKHFDEKNGRALTFTRWKDSIDVEYPTINIKNFVKSVIAALSPAQGDAADKTDFVLPKEAYEKFVAACESPVPANEKLKALFREYSPFLKPSQGDGMRDALVKAEIVRTFEIFRKTVPSLSGVALRDFAALDEAIAALASHPFPQPDMTDELFALLVRCKDREYNPFEPNNQSQLFKDLDAAIKRASQGER